MKKKVVRTLAASLILATTEGIATSCSSDTDSPECPKKPEVITLNCMQPEFLKAGDRVALISPSYNTPMEKIEKTAAVLRGWGLEPVIGPNADKIYEGKYGGTISERVSDIRWALNDPSIKAIICNRGGYGTIQMINELSLLELASTPKWLVGFSDATTLHGLFSRAGVMSIHGTMSSYLYKGGTDASSTLMRDLLMGKVPQYELPAHKQNVTGSASGTLVGGNLCTLAPNVGTLADATVAEDLILFIEEVGESMRNIDRQFNVLALNGVLSRCKGVILGEFPDCGNEFTYENVEAMLRPYFLNYNIPVLCGFPAGHGDVNLPLVMGSRVNIDVREDGASVSFDVNGEQQVVRTAEVNAPEASKAQQLLNSQKIVLTNPETGI